MSRTRLVYVRGPVRKTVHRRGCSRLTLWMHLTKQVVPWEWAEDKNGYQVGDFCAHAGYLCCHACTPLLQHGGQQRSFSVSEIFT